MAVKEKDKPTKASTGKQARIDAIKDKVEKV